MENEKVEGSKRNQETGIRNQVWKDKMQPERKKVRS